MRAVGTSLLSEKEVSGDNKTEEREGENEGVVGRAEDGTKGGTRQGADTIKPPPPPTLQGEDANTPHATATARRYHHSAKGSIVQIYPKKSFSECPPVRLRPPAYLPLTSRL